MKNYDLTLEILVSQEFYQTLRNEAAPQMTCVAVCDDGRVYYWEGYVSIMILVGEEFVALSYAGGSGPNTWTDLIRELCPFCNRTLLKQTKIDTSYAIRSRSQFVFQQ